MTFALEDLEVKDGRDYGSRERNNKKVLMSCSLIPLMFGFLFFFLIDFDLASFSFLMFGVGVFFVVFFLLFLCY